MGGVGKTTLVRKVYENRAIKEYFDRHAWIIVSKSFTPLDLLRSALKSFMDEAKEPVNEGIDKMKEMELINNLKNYLQKKRYIIVFDDIWSESAWDQVRFAFPSGFFGSRVIFTTRIGDIALSTETINHVFNLNPLSDEESWNLFCKKTFRGEYNGVCPKEMQAISWDMMKKCGGLPLAIVAMGGLLAKKEKNALEWRKILESNAGLESLEKILLLSYNDLSYHLKCCILYTSMFPEDYLIKRTKLIRLWISEGFVEEKSGYTLEEVAEHMLNELINRSMIQIVWKDRFNRVTTCQLHDVMRDVIQRKSRNESFSTVLNDKNLPPSEKIHRLAIYENFDDRTKAAAKIVFAGLRSLLFFVPDKFNLNILQVYLEGCTSLRVLELESAQLYKFPQELTQMIHLKYLSLRGTGITEIPYSIRKLKSLEILDLKFCRLSSLSKGILELKNLRQLRCYSYSFDSSPFFATINGIQVPSGIGNLTNLQKLVSVEVGQEENDNVMREIGNLKNLRRLGILKLNGEKGMHLSSTLDKLKHLTALLVSSTGNTEPLCLSSVSSPPLLLQRLFLKGGLKSLPGWIFCLKYLGKLVLQYSRLEDDPIRALQGLQNLVMLDLRDAYLGEELSCDTGEGYPKLKQLFLRQLEDLRRVVLTQGAMPKLRELEISDCQNLEKVPTGTEHLRDLGYLVLSYMPYKFIANIDKNYGPDFWKVEHIGIIQVFP